MRRLLTVALGLAIVAAAMANVARAADNPTGTWKWEVKFNDQSHEVKLKLKLEGDKLTGSIAGRNGDVEIQDGTFKDGDIAFSITRERNGNKMTSKFTGKLSGDTIKGKTEFERNGQAQTRDWEATRVKE
ncbi:MAG TPA: hypothetical protein VHX65_14085 [Pirellulales bacterium]|nr:hypothetical protein [Pirellulales bacterium]